MKDFKTAVDKQSYGHSNADKQTNDNGVQLSVYIKQKTGSNTCIKQPYTEICS